MLWCPYVVSIAHDTNCNATILNDKTLIYGTKFSTSGENKMQWSWWLGYTSEGGQAWWFNTIYYMKLILAKNAIISCTFSTQGEVSVAYP